VNRQGQGVSYSFTIDPADQAKILTVSFDYEVLSGTYATGDLAVYVIQDPAGTPVVLQPAGFQVEAATVGNKVREVCTFQTASNVTSYRLCIHVASTSASAYSIAIDNVSVSPQQVVYGAPVTDWQSYTPTFTGFGTSTGIDVYWRRVGSDVQVRGTFTPGTTTATEARISLPSGLTTTTDVVENTIVGSYGRTATTTSHGGFIIKQSAVSYVKMSPADAFSGANNTALSSANANAVSGGGGDRIAFEFFTPIVGWSSSVVVSSSTDTRVVAANYKKTANQAVTGNVTDISFDSRQFDTHGAWTGSAYVAPVPGFYAISGLVNITTATSVNIAAFVNGTARQIVGTVVNGNNAALGGTIYLEAGQSLSIRSEVNITMLGIAATLAPYLSISRLSGPSQIAASETVAARYVATGNRTPTSVKAVNYDTKVFDTHGAVTTVVGDVAGWKFTCPIAGKYQVSVTALSSVAAASTLFVAKDGASAGFICSSNIGNVMMTGTILVDCVAGNALDVRSDGTPTLNNLAATVLSVSIMRVGQ
jgi:hypothetical protein